MKRHILFLSFALCAGCGPHLHEVQPNSAANDIVGGQNVTNEDFAKHVVAIHNDDLGYWCTGTLISKDTVLTAAHCVNHGTPRSYHVFFSHAPRPGLFDQSKHSVADMKANSQYDEASFTERNDVGVLRFKGDLPAGYEPIALPTAEDLAKMSKNFYAVGYGAVTARKDSLGKGNGVLRYTPMTLNLLVAPQQTQFNVDQSKGHGICYGDSGGPAMTNVGGHQIIFGIASAVFSLDKEAKAQPNFDVCRYNAIYTSVFYYLDWIKKASADIH